MVNQNFSEQSELAFGTKILSINDTPIDEIISRILPYIPADGDNQTRKFNALKRGFYRYYSYYINSLSDSFKIVYEDKLGNLKEVVLNGISKSTLDQKRKLIEKDRYSLPPISYRHMDSLSAAVLKVSSFRNDLMQKHNIDFQDYLTEFFAELKENHSKNLVIDLRDNGGGYSEYAAILYSFLSDTSFQYCKNQIVTTNELIEGIEYDIPETFNGFPEGVVYENGQYKWTKHSILGWREPQKPSFSGNIYFLINGGGISTTSEFVSLAKSNNIGMFIGEEVGGCSAGDSGGVLGWIELPNTKLRVRIAMVKYEINNTTPINKHGVLPDYEINYTLQDILDEKDLEMDYVLEMIRKR